MEFEQVIKGRFSARKYTTQSIEPEKLNAVLEAWRLAPTAKNIQPIKIYVVKSEEWLAKVDKASRCRYWAPTVLIVCGDKESAFERNGHSTYEVDASIVATHMLLEATNQWLGNIWIDLFDRDVIREEFDIPENLQPVCLLPMGYQTEDCPISPLHYERKNLDEIVEER